MSSQPGLAAAKHQLAPDRETSTDPSIAEVFFATPDVVPVLARFAPALLRQERSEDTQSVGSLSNQAWLGDRGSFK